MNVKLLIGCWYLTVVCVIAIFFLPDKASWLCFQLYTTAAAFTSIALICRAVYQRYTFSTRFAAYYTTPKEYVERLMQASLLDQFVNRRREKLERATGLIPILFDNTLSDPERRRRCFQEVRRERISASMETLEELGIIADDDSE